MKIILLLTGLLFSNMFIGQETVLSIPNLNGKIKQSFVVLDESTGNIAVFMDDGAHITGRLYNEEFQLIASAESKRRPNFSKQLIGYEIKGDTFNLLMRSTAGRLFGLLTFDFSQEVVLTQEIAFKFRNEQYIDALIYDNRVHMISVSEKKNAFNIYTLESNLEFSHKEIVIPDEKLLNRKNRPVSLFSLLSKEEAAGPVIDMNTINNDTPNALEAGTKALKLYKQGTIVTFTSDKYNEFTHLITIDVESLQFDVTRIEKHSFGGSRLGVKSNSFFKNNILFQIITNGKALHIRALDVATKTILNEYNVQKKESISFKNTPIYKPGSKEKSLRPEGETSTFLKRISNNYVGITVYERDGNYEVTYGAIIVKEDTGAIIVGGLLFGAIGAVVSTAIMNDASNSFAQYNSSNTLRTTGLFDTSFKNIEGEIKNNVFDNIQRFIQPQIHKINAPTVFNKDNHYYLGFRIKNANTYYMVKFEE
ncbi:MAG: hypothetical protein K0U54_04095 [Bacteroidetes bacterium]|nr:hypothetical protein [Bacteroidota bacterium]